ncbi:hypothetical protein SNE40_012407 [Patella caerulea]|uniref:PiggyBac transposable element-derived protein domain-containing protein n=1 Tax=Patella caerulea TaxID=87958 RepID=A0AAN8JRG2_PATCE
MGGDVIVKLCETLPKHQNYKVVDDNLFTSIALAEQLLDDGILYVGTVRKNRLGPRFSTWGEFTPKGGMAGIQGVNDHTLSNFKNDHIKVVQLRLALSNTVPRIKKIVCDNHQEQISR